MIGPLSSHRLKSSPSPWVVAGYLLGKLDADPGHWSFLSSFFCCYIKRKNSLLVVRLHLWEGGTSCPQASKEYCLISRVQWRHCYFHFPKSNPSVLYTHTHTPFPLACSGSTFFQVTLLTERGLNPGEWIMIALSYFMVIHWSQSSCQGSTMDI